MAEKKFYTIYFMYDVIDHSLRFPMRAEVEGADTGVYTITNIRQDGEHEGNGQHDGGLLPPIKVQKEGGVWKILDMETTSRLSAAIGAAIDDLEQSA